MASQQHDATASSADDPSSTAAVPRVVTRLKLIGIKMGRTLTQTVAATVLSSHIAATTMAAEFATAATAMTVAQAQLATQALAVVRVSVDNNERLQQVARLVTEYAAQNPTALAEIQQLSLTNTAALSLRSNIIGSLVAGAVQEAVAVAFYLSYPATTDAAELKATSQQVAATTAASLAFSAGGAAVGAVVLPGAGAVIGSLIGGIGGSYVTGIVAAQLTAPDPDRQRGYGPPDRHSAFGAVTRDEGDYVLVMLPDVPSCHFSTTRVPVEDKEVNEAAMMSPPSRASLLQVASAPTETSQPASQVVLEAVESIDVGLSELVLLFQQIDDDDDFDQPHPMAEPPQRSPSVEDGFDTV
jgi:hypothetical protein